MQGGRATLDYQEGLGEVVPDEQMHSSCFVSKNLLWCRPAVSQRNWNPSRANELMSWYSQTSPRVCEAFELLRTYLNIQEP